MGWIIRLMDIDHWNWEALQRWTTNGERNHITSNHNDEYSQYYQIMGKCNETKKFA